jgi:large subunit ribosomal protein L6
VSRVGNKLIEIPKGIEVTVTSDIVRFKGPKGEMSHAVHSHLDLKYEDNVIQVIFKPEDGALAGTCRALLNNILVGVSQGFQKKLLLQGVGYRAQIQGDVLNLTLGFSHPVNFKAPEGIKIETPSQTEIIVTGTDKQLVGQVAADIRSFRPPEPYKGKGIRYADEHIIRKETKKK